MTKEELIRRRRMELRRKRRRKKKIIRAAVLAGLFLFVILIISLFVSLIKNIFFDKEKDTSEQQIAQSTATILTAGDIILHEPFLTSEYYLNEDGSYDYNRLFSYIFEDYKDADLSVINLETSIADKDFSTYPRYKSPEKIVTALKDNHIDMCLLANNHIYDNQDAGLKRTIQAVENNNLLYTGVQKKAADDNFTILDINGIKVGILNYTFDSGAKDGKDVSINSIPVSEKSQKLINTFNYGGIHFLYSEIEEQLTEMKKAGVEYTIAYIHWGKEYETVENERQQAIAQELCNLGINALIGGHPHVIQPIDLITSEDGSHQMLCVYSMGNHLSGQTKEHMDDVKSGHTEDGLMVKLTIEKNSEGIVALTNAEFIPTWTYYDIDENDQYRFYVLPLDNPKELYQKAPALDIKTDVKESLERTNAIIETGIKKVNEALPLS